MYKSVSTQSQTHSKNCVAIIFSYELLHAKIVGCIRTHLSEDTHRKVLHLQVQMKNVNHLVQTITTDYPDHQQRQLLQTLEQLQYMDKTGSK